MTPPNFLTEVEQLKERADELSAALAAALFELLDRKSIGPRLDSAIAHARAALAKNKETT